MSVSILYLFFFFQAEDGIRDLTVTGVQTCALPISDIRVLEMGQLLAGPFCGQLLGDFGAEVIKIEPPGAGDPMREWGPAKVQGKSLQWSILARNKKSVTLDLRVERGQEVVRRLVANADVL